ncbi:hypothetical protein JB92DRAFT_1549151 [Gautieria morchelliformis]|nr:hypothetical protein JB92DRAFT_1549151 [Gautieria morchelliformis]
MATSTSQPAQQTQNDPLYEFSVYPFSTDPVFQAGLRSIVSSTPGESSDELENIIGQAKVFYFARTTGYQVTWKNYLEWRKSHPSPGPDNQAISAGAGSEACGTASPGEEGGKSAQLTFQQITDLINTGQTHLIPNNNLIPEALHGDPPSESTNPTRRKPWEQAQPDEVQYHDGGASRHK